MLKKRIIPCLDIKGGRTVKGVHFRDLKDAGDPVALAARYAAEGADELVFLDITATQENRKTLYRLVEKIAAAIHIPFTVGGGIGTHEDAATLIQAGADKVSLNSAATRNPQLITQIAERFGSQCVVVAIDIKQQEDGVWKVYRNGGNIATGLEAMAWAETVVGYGAGELLLTSMDHDGVQQGFALEITDAISSKVGVPVIASGGAGNPEHFFELFSQTTTAAALAAGIFHFGAVSLPEVKTFLKTRNVPVR